MSFKKTLLLTTLITFLVWPIMSGAQSSEDLTGKILLQVEQNGEAWYVDPRDDLRYFLGRPADAFRIMREHGAGISDQDLAKIQPSLKHLKGPDSDGDGLPDAFEEAVGTDPYNPDTSNNGHSDKTEIENGYDPLKKEGNLPVDQNFAQAQAGKILLQVKKNGEAWYINPEDNKRHFLGRPADAFRIMRNLGLGISDQDLDLIEKGNAKEDIITNEEETETPTAIELEATSNKEVYHEGDELELSVEISSGRDIDLLEIEAKGLVNNWGSYYFHKTKRADIKKGEPETIKMQFTVPECSACTGIEPGSHHIEITVLHQGEKLEEQRVNFEIQ